MDNRNFYSMPAPWGGIVLREENGELASICPTIASIQAPSPAPLAIADAMQQLEAVLTKPLLRNCARRSLPHKSSDNCRTLRAVSSTLSAALNQDNG